MANVLAHKYLTVTAYGAIVKIPETGPGPPHKLDILTHIDCYIYELITDVQGGRDRQREVFDGTVWALEWFFPSLPTKTKDPVSLKNLMAGEVDWTCVKEFWGGCSTCRRARYPYQSGNT